MGGPRRVSASLQDMILKLADRDDLATEMAGFYDRLDRTIADRGPTCWNHGSCCKFGEFGHKLFVTTVELAYFVRGNRDDWRPPSAEDSCPFQFQGKCTAREHRPMGCRIFFCDPTAQHWQNDEYEKQLRTLKAISTTSGVDYRYIEWLHALRKVPLGGHSPRWAPNPGASGASEGVDPTPLHVIQ